MNFDWNYWIIVLAVSIVLFYSSYRRERNRRNDLAIVAKRFGFKFYPKGRSITFNEHRSFKLFSRGTAGSIKNEMWGQANGCDLKIFGYYYQSSSSSESDKYHQTVVSIQNSGIRLPDFQLEPEGIFHFIAEVFGYQDINIDSNPEFSLWFLLRGNQVSRIRKIFTGRVVNFFLANRAISVESKDGKIIFYEHDRRCNPEEIYKLINLANELVTVFKASIEHSRQPTEIRPDPSAVISYDWPGR